MPRFAVPGLAVPKMLRGLPPAVVRQILSLIVVNILIWAAIGVVLRFFPSLISSAVLSYTLGLRHALDADHISAIDLMTRRLIASGQQPVSVGTWFSLGHSTIVVITCIVVAATSGALRERFDGFQRIGNIIGTSISAAFLLILCAANSWVLYRLVSRLRVLLREQRLRVSDGDNAVMEQEDTAAGQLSLEGAGFLANVFRKCFRIVDRPWKMYPLGVLFGLGFDTSSEIAILGIASIQGATGTSLWLILIFPVLFTGKCSFPSLGRLICTGSKTDKGFRFSWHVSPRHHRRCFDDDSVHFQSLGKRSYCHSVLLGRADWHYHCRLRLHRRYTAPDPHIERCRARRPILGWCGGCWG